MAGTKHGQTGRRALKVRLKTARGRSLSSQRWLERQLNDPYVEAARREGYRSRAAFKLKEIDDKHRILKPGSVIVDLGAAPGGWSQVAAERTGLKSGRTGHVIAVDIAAMEPLAGVSVLHLDFLSPEAPRAILAALEGRGVDGVLSDMAGSTTGHRETDHLRIMGLAEAAAEFAGEVLKPGGFFLCKVLQGGTARALLESLKKSFASVKHVKPKASRSDSAELYVLATGFRARSGDAASP
jgi:23S rRNA (uridine2552-2'-O)-methyltransferase